MIKWLWTWVLASRQRRRTWALASRYWRWTWALASRYWRWTWAFASCSGVLYMYWLWTWPSVSSEAVTGPVVAQQPHPDPNYAPHAAVHLLAVAWRTSAWNATSFDFFGIENCPTHTQPVGVLAYIISSLILVIYFCEYWSFRAHPIPSGTPPAMHLSTESQWRGTE